jgi:hypothetical protein
MTALILVNEKRPVEPPQPMTLDTNGGGNNATV